MYRSPQSPHEIRPESGLTHVVRIGYSSGNLGKSFVWTSFESVLLYFLVLHVGVPVVFAGGLLTVLMVWDGLADLAVSYRTDRTGRRDGLARLILTGAPLCGGFFVLVYAAPLLAGSGTVGTVLAVMAVVASRVGYTLCDVGHNTLLVRVAAADRNAAGVSALRLIFSALGAGCAGLALARVLSLEDMAGQGRAFIAFGLTGGGLYLVTLLVARGVTRHLPATSSEPVRGSALQMARNLWSNRDYRAVLGIIAVQSALIPFFTRALPFLGRAIMADPAWPGWALSVITLGQSLSLPLWMLAARRRGSRDLMAFAHVGLLLALAGFALTFGHATATGFLALLGVSQAGMGMAVWAMLASSIRSHGPGHDGGEALPVGLFLATLKVASGMGTMVLSALLAAAGIDPMHGAGESAQAALLASVGIPMAGSVVLLIAHCLANAPGRRAQAPAHLLPG
nr:MFS transporter [Novosphingobium panipatense]